MLGHMRKLFSVVLVAVLIVGVYALMMPGDAYAKKPGGENKCGECPCAEEIELPNGMVCWLDSCVVMVPYPDCLWECNYTCPFPLP